MSGFVFLSLPGWKFFFSMNFHVRVWRNTASILPKLLSNLETSRKHPRSRDLRLSTFMGRGEIFRLASFRWRQSRSVYKQLVSLRSNAHSWQEHRRKRSRTQTSWRNADVRGITISLWTCFILGIRVLSVIWTTFEFQLEIVTGARDRQLVELSEVRVALF